MPSILTKLINEGLDVFERHCTDAARGLDEVSQRELVAQWLLAKHQTELREFYDPLLKKEIARRQQFRARSTRPTANQIISAASANGSRSNVVAIQPPLLASFATERYYVAPNVSKLGRDMSLREAYVALRVHQDSYREHQAKFERLAAVIELALRRGLGQGDSLGRLFAAI